MTDNWLSVGILQLAYHPAAVVRDWDILDEPVVPKGEQYSFALLSRRGIDMGEAASLIRTRYLDWLRVRVVAMIDQLAAAGKMPDLVVLPECSVPREALPVLREKAKAHGLVIVAGTHTPSNSQLATEVYKQAGLQKRALERLANEKLPPQLLPILSSRKTVVIDKEHPSIFERGDLSTRDASQKGVAIAGTTLQLHDSSINAALVVCADALRLPSHSQDFQVVVIAAYERDPTRFDPHISMLRGVGVPVVLANAAEFGGSGVFVNVDSREPHWWYRSSLGGRAPVGECYIEIDVNLTQTAVQVGLATPAQTARVRRILPILATGGAVSKLDDEARNALAAKDYARLRGVVDELERHSAAGPLVRDRWRMLVGCLRNGQLDDEIVKQAGETLSISGVPSLEELEQELCRDAANALETKLERAVDTLQSADYGEAHKALVGLRARAAGRTQSSKDEDRAGRDNIPSFGHSEECRAILQFINGDAKLLQLRGLPGIGKSTVIRSALARAGARSLFLRCPKGASADYIFENLMLGAGRFGSGVAPRSTFDVTEIGEVLTGYDVVVLQDADRLVMEEGWATAGIAALMAALLSAVASDSNAKLIVEARRTVPFEVSSSVRHERQWVQGVAPADAADLLMQGLRRAGIANITTADQRLEIARLAHGHPVLLRLCAEYIQRDGVDAVLLQLRRRQGFYRDALEGIIEGLRPSVEEKGVLRCLSECRAPVPIEALNVCCTKPASDMARNLEAACFLMRTAGGLVHIAPLIDAIALSYTVPDVTRKRFHAAVEKHFFAVFGSERGERAFTAGVEANYHASSRGTAPPCHLTGLRDHVVAVAQSHMDAQRNVEAVELLKSVVDTSSLGTLARGHEDILVLYASALGKSGNVSGALDVIGWLVKTDSRHALLYIRAGESALRLKQFENTERAITLARSILERSPDVAKLVGRLAEARHLPREAVACYQQALDWGDRTGWAHYYLARCLLRLGDPEYAITVVHRGRGAVEERFGRAARNVETALMVLEMEALVLSSDFDGAMKLAEALEGIERVRPEVVCCLAFTRAAKEAAAGRRDQALSAFDAAIERLTKDASINHRDRARNHLYRGKLLEIVGDLRGAEVDYRQAAASDQLSMHVLECQARALSRLIEHYGRDVSFEMRLTEVRRTIQRLRDSDGRR